jgi:hypothetical protein
MDADGTNPETVAECDPDLFCDFPSWGAYDGPLPSLAAARVRRAATASASSRSAHRPAARRMRREVRQRLRVSR